MNISRIALPVVGVAAGFALTTGYLEKRNDRSFSFGNLIAGAAVIGASALMLRSSVSGVHVDLSRLMMGLGGGVAVAAGVSLLHGRRGEPMAPGPDHGGLHWPYEPTVNGEAVFF